jgi:hypothetical protein
MSIPSELGDKHPMDGAYRNDCPYCHTHNAILYSPQYQKGGSRIDTHECRDCHRLFMCENGNWITIKGRPYVD